MKLNLDYRTAYVVSAAIRTLARMGLDPAFTPVQVSVNRTRHYPVPGGPDSLDGDGTVARYRLWGGGVSVTAKVTSETPPPGGNAWTHHWVHALQVTTADKRRWLWRSGWPRAILMGAPERPPGHFLRLQAEKRKAEPQRRRSSRSMFRAEKEEVVYTSAPRPPMPV